MTALAIALLIALLIANAAWMYVHEHAQERWRRERSELLTRIQHPELIHPVLPVTPQELVVAEAEDEIGVVGMVHTGLSRDD